MMSALAGVFGVIVGATVPDFLHRSEARAQQQVTYNRQKAVLALCIRDLRQALLRVRKATQNEGKYPPSIMDPELIYFQPLPNGLSPSEPRIKKYYLVSTVYRLSALLGWMELYRSDMNFLRGSEAERRSIATCWDKIASDLSEIGDARDAYLLRDEQRAVGERLLLHSGTPTVIGYAEFCKTLFGLPNKSAPTEGEFPKGNHYQPFQDYWIFHGTTHFLATPEQTDCQARVQRLDKLVQDLDDFDKVLKTAD